MMVNRIPTAVIVGAFVGASASIELNVHPISATSVYIHRGQSQASKNRKELVRKIVRMDNSHSKVGRFAFPRSLPSKACWTMHKLLLQSQHSLSQWRPMGRLKERDHTWIEGKSRAPCSDLCYGEIILGTKLLGMQISLSRRSTLSSVG